MSYIDEGYNFLLGVDQALDNADGINTRNVDQIMESGAVTFDYTSMNVLSPNQDMQSEEFITGVQGWQICGDGNAEFSNITLTGGVLKYAKTSFTDAVNTGYYLGPEGAYFGKAADVTKLKFDIATGNLDLIGTISGRNTATIASAINSSGNFINELINTKLDTQSKSILGDFVFSGSGAIKMNTDANNGIWLSPTGILGKKAGVTTFAVDILGDATFGGTLVAASGTFGTVTAGNLNGLTITGGTIQTAVPPADRVELSSANYFSTYKSGFKRVWINHDSINFYDGAGTSTGTIYGDTGILELLTPFGNSISLTTTHNASYCDPIILRARTGAGVYTDVAKFFFDPIALETSLIMQGANNKVEAENFVVTNKINTQAGTTYTLALSDISKLIKLTNASPVAVTIPTNVLIPIPIGSQIDLVQYGAGKVTFSGAGVTINSKSSNKSIAAQYVGVSLYKINTDEWLLLGDLIT